jgi:hypothetical protein
MQGCRDVRKLFPGHGFRVGFPVFRVGFRVFRVGFPGVPGGVSGGVTRFTNTDTG